MAGRFAKGQKVRVPEGLDVPWAHQYAGQIGTATGYVGSTYPEHDQADFGGRLGLFAEGQLEAVPQRSEFQKGQTIRAIRATESAYGNRFTVGTVLVVTNPDMYGRPSSHPHHRLGVNTPAGAAEAPSASEWVVNPADFELVELDPSKVKAGDTVTLEREDGTLIRAKVFDVDPVVVNPPERTLRLYGIPDWVLIGKDSYALTDHQPAPKPQPPTAPGSVVLVHSSSRAWPNGLPLLRQHTGRWIGQNGQSWSDRDVAHANGGTFEVIHDAGKAIQHEEDASKG